MSLYLDDDTADRRLAALLSHAGHRVVMPASVHLSGAPDARHFIHAMQHELILVTRNHDDFLDLHEVVQVAHGTHPGILTSASIMILHAIGRCVTLSLHLPISHLQGFR